MTKLFEDLKAGLEEAVAYNEGKDTRAVNTLIEEENERIEKLNNLRFWLSVETDSRKVYAHKLLKKYRNEMVQITRLQALCEHENGTAFTKQALDKLEGK